MVEREELLGFGGASTARVAVSEGEATAGGEAEVLVMGAGAEAK